MKHFYLYLQTTIFHLISRHPSDTHIESSWSGLTWRDTWTIDRHCNTQPNPCQFPGHSSQLAIRISCTSPGPHSASPHLTSPAIPTSPQDHRPQTTTHSMVSKNSTPTHPPAYHRWHRPIHWSLPNEQHPHPTVARPRSRLLFPERLESANHFLRNRERSPAQPPRTTGPSPLYVQSGSRPMDRSLCARSLARFCTEARRGQTKDPG